LLSAAAAATVGLLGLAGPASASSAAANPLWFHGEPAINGALSAKSAPAINDELFAGYRYNGALPSANWITSFTVPKLICSHTKSLVGVGLATTGGSSFAAVLLEAGCKKGSAHYDSILFNNSQHTQGGAAPKAGDKLVLQEKASSTKVVLFFTDKTNPKASAKLSTPGGSGFNPEIGELKPFHKTSGGSAPYHIPDFGKIAFTNSKLNGQPFGSFPVARFDMVNATMTLQIATGRFASDNKSFKSFFKHP
jgi:hypothetical protein